MRHFLSAFLGALAVPLVLAAPLAAQSVATGFSAERFEPADPASTWLALDSLDMRGKTRPAVGLLVSYARKPLVLYDPEGKQAGAVITSQLFAHLSASAVLGERVRIGLNLPLAPFVGGDGGVVGTTQLRVDEGFAFGDMRLSADVRLSGEHTSPITTALGLALWVPTGKEAAYVGDGKVRLQPHFLMAGAVARFRYALRLGFRYRARDESYPGADLGSEITFAGAMGVAITDRIQLGPEVIGATVLIGGPFRGPGTPLEVLLGLHYEAENGARFKVGGGPGLTQGLGAPELRAVASIGWAPKARPPRRTYAVSHDRGHDADGDGVPDGPDACPNAAGVLSDDPAKMGCPPSDVDADGISDAEDACPSAVGARSADRTKNGCVVRDGDGDGIEDHEDACADKAGVATANPRTNGCTDSDKDGIFDPIDACATVSGTPNIDPGKSGCPIARVEAGQIRITEQVQFQRGNAHLLPASEDVLLGISRVLLDRPDITEVSVEGHTDNSEGRGRRALKLSKQRVETVLTWLAQHGVSPTRLRATGYGAERPLAPNLTEEGRAQNRRVEFHILSINGRPVDAQGNPI